MPSPFTDGATILPIDAIQEFKFMENPKAEYGLEARRSGERGDQSGTNTLHGAAYAFGRSDSSTPATNYNVAPVGGAARVQDCERMRQIAGTVEAVCGVVGWAIKKTNSFLRRL